MGVGTLRRIVRDGVTKLEDVTPKEEKPKNYNPGKEESKRRRKLEKLENEIAGLEENIEELKTQLTLPENSSNYTKLQELQSKIDESEEKLLLLMEEWENYAS